MPNPYDPRLAGAAAQMSPQFRQELNRLHGAQRINDRNFEHISQRLSDLSTALNAMSGQRTGEDHPGVIRIEDIPGRRVPYMMLVDIPIGSNVTSKRQASVTISQEGPFVAVKRTATFQSAFEFQTTNPETQARGRFAGRSYGRYRPIHSAWDANDSQHNSYGDSTAWWLAQSMLPLPDGSPMPSGTLGMPSNMSSFRTMEFDGRITVINAGSSYPRQNLSVPSSMWSYSINEPWTLGALDFFERGEVLTIEVQPNHVNNPPAGNVDGSAIFPNVAGLGTAQGWPFVEGQYDAHEGIATPGASVIQEEIQEELRLPELLQDDSVDRLPEGILTIGWCGYRIIQPIGPVG
jgi:hypothetical protein